MCTNGSFQRRRGLRLLKKTCRDSEEEEGGGGSDSQSVHKTQSAQVRSSWLQNTLCMCRKVQLDPTWQPRAACLCTVHEVHVCRPTTETCLHVALCPAAALPQDVTQLSRRLTHSQVLSLRVKTRRGVHIQRQAPQSKQQMQLCERWHWLICCKQPSAASSKMVNALTR